ncbi:folylpolyglutamate synthase/dihydrofolate synthase family protein [Paraflavitalea sp. CAU 1676]|uniref:bifunctional folylpolyglutamate synthase/dihydrofolate synthase n=1 Tax=Paraflavitalea sp. CAU 1676 TaxID=3032598 RepID=UPI0023DB3782|nr:folylpolyglutamate synthase/dihydrofolate synthase family protein [Paraflavitalea sp. CAU 1676]MDF2189218.1 bifunctional folylpolyglutamate synthase/dihydrofolate synthase [Paraflavitalea sp. CAU 1676]
MTYEETLHYLFTRLPMFSRIGAAAYKKDLTNTIQLCDLIGNPQRRFKTIHIAGTNGKGSTSHMLAAILQKAGYKTGLYTSPHLRDFRERFRIDGAMIEESFIVDFTKRIQPAIDSIEPSFFEITVAMAFDYFEKNNVDIAVIETGLGGRLDSTNIITPELSIITNIGWDHMNLLGDTLEKIAFEKAGIIKPGIPVVVGETAAETRAVFQQVAAEKNAPLYFADQLRYAADWKMDHHHLKVQVTRNGHDERLPYRLDLAGFYQTKNLVTVLEAVHQLQQRGFTLPAATVQDALHQVKPLTGLHGRWDIIQQHPFVVLDVGHNEDGMRQIVSQIELTEHEHLHIVIGMVKDKEIEKVLQQLPKEANYYFTKAHIPRALPEDELATQAAAHDLQGLSYADVNTALKAALQKAQKNDLIVVCGSVFVVGEVKL